MSQPPPENKKHWIRFLSPSQVIFSESFFITIACVLGTGILALPCKLAFSGFAPFLVNALVCTLMQIILNYTFVEVLQHADAQLSASSSSSSPSSHAASSASSHESPDLHTMGNLYLSPFLRRVFDFFVVVHFVSILVSYALASSEAYGSLFNYHATSNLITPLVCIFSLIIIFGGNSLVPVLSIGTAFKAILLVFMIAIVGIVAEEIDLQPSTSWRGTLDSFLLCTVALGGIVNVIPLLYSKARDNPSPAQSIRAMRSGISFGLIACCLLNLIWCHFVLSIVPQVSADNGVSLAQAAANGLISTVPLKEVIMNRSTTLAGFANTVSAFVTLSISVSFLTIGSSFKHVLDGFARFGELRIRAWRNRIALASASSPISSSPSSPDAPPIIIEEHVVRVGERAPLLSSSSSAGLPDELEVRRRSSKVEAQTSPLSPNSHSSPKASQSASLLFHASSILLPKHDSSLPSRFPLPRPLALILYIVVFGSCLIIALSQPKGFLVVLEYFSALALNIACGLLVVVMFFSARRKINNNSAPVAVPMNSTFLVICAGSYFALATLYNITASIAKTSGHGFS